MKIITIAIFTIVLTICDLGSAGITDYPLLAKIVLADVKPSVRVRTVKQYKSKINANESAIFDFIGLVQQHNGYKASEHETTTTDGFHIKIHRIFASPKSPKADGKPVVFLQHGIGGSSDFYVIFGPDQALAFQLADAGYDVWIGNVRGNTYNRIHEKYGTEDPRFWAYSLDDVAVYDLSRSIDYVLEQTQQKSLTFVGYSMGTTISYMLLSSKPEYNDKINLLVSVTPVVYYFEPSDMIMSAMLNGILWLNTLALKVLKTKNTFEVLPQAAVFEKFGRESCRGTGFNPCKLFFTMVADVDSIDPEMFAKIFAYLPAGVSYNVLKHFAQLLTTNGRFQMYDYDSCGWMDYVCPASNTTNMAKYNQTTPPEYNLSLVTTPNVIYYSKTDIISPEKNVAPLRNKIPNIVAFKEIKGDKTFNHLDFFWHKDARSKVYNHMLKMIRRYNKRQ